VKCNRGRPGFEVAPAEVCSAEPDPPPSYRPPLVWVRRVTCFIPGRDVQGQPHNSPGKLPCKQHDRFGQAVMKVPGVLPSRICNVINPGAITRDARDCGKGKDTRGTSRYIGLCMNPPAEVSWGSAGCRRKCGGLSAHCPGWWSGWCQVYYASGPYTTTYFLHQNLSHQLEIKSAYDKLQARQFSGSDFVPQGSSGQTACGLRLLYYDLH